jgi:hypothetical protein
VDSPNLFHFGTSDLSRDAFLAWVLAWSDSRWKNLDPALHGLGTRFVSALLGLHDRASVTNGSLKIRVERQVSRVNIVAEINNGIVLAIEDRTGGCSHQGNDEAIESLNWKYPGREVLAISIKTGDQASSTDAVSPGFKPFLPVQFIALLHEDKRLLSRNNVVSEFCAFLERRESDIQAWRYQSVTEWTRQSTPWIGFFQSLQTEFADLDWKYVPNAYRGFISAWWNWRSWDRAKGAQLYLQINQGPLQFRAAGMKDTDDSIPICQGAALQLRQMGEVYNLDIEKARLLRGETMAIAQIEQDFWVTVRPNGLIDLTRTLDNLRLAASLLESLSTCEASPPTPQLVDRR